MARLAPLWLAGLIPAVLLWLVIRAIAHPIVPAVADRMALAVAWLLPSILVLAAGIVTQALTRAGTGTIDPTAGRDSPFLVRNQRVISNNVEQLSVFAPALLAFAAGLAPDRMNEAIASAIVFAVARLAFWLGYLVSPVLRAPGMTATFAANATTLLGAIWVWLS